MRPSRRAPRRRLDSQCDQLNQLTHALALVAGLCCCRSMTMTADELPDDLNALRAMVLSREAENARLRQIIKELQRHRFGRRAETLPEDQLLLGLEEAEQVETDGLEEKEYASSDLHRERGAKRRINRGSLPAHLPRIDVVIDIENHGLPLLRQRPAPDRRGRQREARHRAGPVPRSGDAPPQIRLPRL